MLFSDVIRTKRDGGELNDKQIRFFVDGLVDKSIPAEQISALAMAIFLNSMNSVEAAQLTRDMANSGTVLDWSEVGLDGPIVDKHSTGGVGDKVSFLLAPIAAACGCYVPMISGRGLGHTGGTTDKIESIPGYNTSPNFATFQQVVKQTGCAIIGQTPDLAPADKRLYAIRDVTATVESVPLITASILAKKLAAGLDALVMDVKVGNGAFMTSIDEAHTLAESILATASAASLKTHVLITDMNQPLGLSVGNALEIQEVVHFLRNDYREPRLNEVTLVLCAEMLMLAGMATDRDSAYQRCDLAVTSGQAAEVFAAMSAGLGGPANFLERSSHYLPEAEVVRSVYASGYLSRVDTRQIGNAIIALGGGRQTLTQSLNLSVGFSHFASIGNLLDHETPLAVVHAATDEDAQLAETNLRKACLIVCDQPPQTQVVHEILVS